MKTYEKRHGGVVLERVTNVQQDGWRAKELDGWVAVRRQLRLSDGWYLVADDGDAGPPDEPEHQPSPALQEPAPAPAPPAAPAPAATTPAGARKARGQKEG